MNKVLAAIYCILLDILKNTGFVRLISCCFNYVKEIRHSMLAKQEAILFYYAPEKRNLCVEVCLENDSLL